MYVMTFLASRHPKIMVFYAGTEYVYNMGVRPKPSNFGFERICRFSFSARTPECTHLKGFHRESNILCMNECGNGSDIVIHVPPETHISPTSYERMALFQHFIVHIRIILITMKT